MKLLLLVIFFFAVTLSSISAQTLLGSFFKIDDSNKYFNITLTLQTSASKTIVAFESSPTNSAHSPPRGNYTLPAPIAPSDPIVAVPCIFNIVLQPTRTYDFFFNMLFSDGTRSTTQQITSICTGNPSTCKSKPAPPTNIQLLGSTKESLFFRWDAFLPSELPLDVVYFVFYAIGPVTTTGQSNAGAENFKNITGLQSNTVYSIGIQSGVDAATSKSIMSQIAYFKTNISDPPTAAPSNIRFNYNPIAGTSFYNLVLTWTTVTGAADGGSPISDHILQFNYTNPDTGIVTNNTIRTGSAVGVFRMNETVVGTYSFIVSAVNKDGFASPPSQAFPLNIQSIVNQDGLLGLLSLLAIPIGLVIVILATIAIVALVLMVRAVKKSKEVHIEVSQALIPTEEELQASRELLDQIAKQYKLEWDKLIFSTNELLGTGAQGTVYKGSYFSAPVAVKLFMKNNFGVDKDLQEFFTEAKFLSEHSNHPNIIRFIGVAHHEEQNQIAIVTELCTGGNLANYVEQHKDIPWVKKIQILFGISSGMAHLHSCNIIHRDLKCENVLLDHLLQPKIIDFGFSKQIQDMNKTMNMTMNVGTAVYSAPEVVKFQIFATDIFEGQDSEDQQSNANLMSNAQHATVTSDDDGKVKKKLEYDMKCDVYSFAIIMWVLYFNTKHPYGRGVTDLQILHQISVNPDFRPPVDDSQISESDKWYIDTMRSCWKSEPTDRPNFEYLATLFQEKITQLKQAEQKQ